MQSRACGLAEKAGGIRSKTSLRWRRWWRENKGSFGDNAKFGQEYTCRLNSVSHVKRVAPRIVAIVPLWFYARVTIGSVFVQKIIRAQIIWFEVHLCNLERKE